MGSANWTAITSREPGRRCTSKKPARSCPTCQPRSRWKLSRGEKSAFVNRPDGRAAPSAAGSARVPAGRDGLGEDALGDALGDALEPRWTGGPDRGADVADEQLVAMLVAAANATRTRLRAIDTPLTTTTHQILVAAGLSTVSIRRRFETCSALGRAVSERGI